MRILLVFGASAMLASCGSDGNVYDMPVADVYARLANYRPEPSNRGPFGRLTTNVTGSGGRSVTWTASGSHASRRCVVSLVPVDEARTQVDLDCGGASPSDGAAAGLALKHTRFRVIEMIDARLRGRDYDPQLAMGATASWWPADEAGQGDLATAQGEALAMERELRQAQQASQAR